MRPCSSAKKQVLIMGTRAWYSSFNSVQIQIRTLGIMAEFHRGLIGRLEARVEGKTPATEKARNELKKTRELLEETTDAINELWNLCEQTKDFGEPSQCVIGHVVWSPAITTGIPLRT